MEKYNVFLCELSGPAKCEAIARVKVKNEMVNGSWKYPHSIYLCGNSDNCKYRCAAELKLGQPDIIQQPQGAIPPEQTAPNAADVVMKLALAKPTHI